MDCCTFVIPCDICRKCHTVLKPMLKIREKKYTIHENVTDKIRSIQMYIVYISLAQFVNFFKSDRTIYASVQKNTHKSTISRVKVLFLQDLRTALKCSNSKSY